MKSVLLRPALLAAAVLLAAEPAWAAVPLKDLTQEKIRDWAIAAVKASRDDPAWAAFWKETDPLVVVDAGKIIYEHDKGVPVRLLWDVKAKQDLSRPEHQTAIKNLRKIFHYAIRAHDKGLLSEDDARLLEAVARFQTTASPKMRPLKDLTEDQVRDWVAEAVKATRQDPAWAETWKQLDRLTVVDAQEVVYEHDKDKPVKLVWDVVPRKALTADQRGKVETDLKKLFHYILFEHDKGIVPAGEMDALKAVVKADVRPNPMPRPRPAKLPPTTEVTDLTEDTVHDWMDISYETARKDPALADTWKELDALVEIDPNAIVYEHDKGVPTKLHWEVAPKRPLTAEERLKVKTDLEKLFNAMLFEHDKGLVPAAEMEIVKDVVAVDVGPDPEPPVAVNPPDNPTDVEKVKKALDDLKVEFDKLKKDHADAQTEIEKLKKAHDDDQVEIDKAKKDRADAMTEVDKLKKMHADALTDIEKFKKEGGAAAVELDKLKKEHAGAQDELEKLKKAQADALTEFQKLQKEHAESLTEVERFKKDIAGVQTENQRLKTANDKSLLDIEKLKQQSQGSANAGGPGGPTGAGGNGAGYIMTVQPSSMIYYDCCSHCWLPGPARVVYYPAAPAARREEMPRGSAVAPLPSPSLLPPPERQESRAPDAPPEPPGNAPDEAGRAFWIGYRAYWQGDYERALASCNSAIRLNNPDARFWYYKALAERAVVAAETAEASAARGRELHAALKPKADLVATALERVQGQERRFLNAPEVAAPDR